MIPIHSSDSVKDCVNTEKSSLKLFNSGSYQFTSDGITNASIKNLENGLDVSKHIQRRVGKNLPFPCVYSHITSITIEH